MHWRANFLQIFLDVSDICRIFAAEFVCTGRPHTFHKDIVMPEWWRLQDIAGNAIRAPSPATAAGHGGNENTKAFRLLSCIWKLRNFSKRQGRGGDDPTR